MRVTPLCVAIAAMTGSALAGTISIQPLSNPVALGNPVDINVNISGISDLYAFQFDITFNPALLSASTVSEGRLFSSSGVAFSPGFIDNVGGSITFIGDSLSGPSPGISTNGTLVQIVFNTIRAGTSSVDLANIILLNSNLNDIPATAVGASVSVTGTASTPEPGTGMLLGIAVVAIGIANGWRRRDYRRHWTTRH